MFLPVRYLLMTNYGWELANDDQLTVGFKLYELIDTIKDFRVTRRIVLPLTEKLRKSMDEKNIHFRPQRA